MQLNKGLNKKGFSLLELLVVIAIVGVIAAIAAPTYQRYRGRAAMAEYTAIAKYAKDKWQMYHETNNPGLQMGIFEDVTAPGPVYMIEYGTGGTLLRLNSYPAQGNLSNSHLSDQALPFLYAENVSVWYDVDYTQLQGGVVKWICSVHILDDNKEAYSYGDNPALTNDQVIESFFYDC